MLHPERWEERDDEEIIYSDDDPHQSDSSSEEDGDEWGINWDNMECVDEYGDDGEDTSRATANMRSEEMSPDEKFHDLELDPVDELVEGPSSSQMHSRGRQERARPPSEEDKNESDEEEGDPWSRWVGVDSRKEMDGKKPTMAELVLKGKISGGEAARDKKNRGVMGRSPPRRKTPPRSPRRRKTPPRSPRRRKTPPRSPPRRKNQPRSPLRRKAPSRSPLRRMSPAIKSPAGREIMPSPPLRRERSPNERRRISPLSHDRRRDRSPRRIRSPSIERRGRIGSPAKKDRPLSPPRKERKEDERRRESRRSPERRRTGGEDASMLPSSNRESTKYERRPLPSKIETKHTVHRPSPPVRRRRSRSPIGVKHRVSSPNRVILGERGGRRDKSPRREEKRKERSRSPIVSAKNDVINLLEKQEEERPKERSEREAREERSQKGSIEEKDRKRHVPIVWDETETHARKMHRSIGHVDGIEGIGKRTKEEKRREENVNVKKREDNIGMASIPLSMLGRVGKCSLDVLQKPIHLSPSKSDTERKRSVDSSSHSVPLVWRDHVAKESIEFSHRLQPTDLVRIISNNEAPIKGAKIERIIHGIEKRKEEGEVGESDEECGWLSANLQGGHERMERKTRDPSSGALRLFGRATASAVCSSSMKDAMKEGRRITGPDMVEEDVGLGKKVGTSQRRRIEPGKLGKKRRNKTKFGAKQNEAQSGCSRLLEVYY